MTDTKDTRAIALDSAIKNLTDGKKEPKAQSTTDVSNNKKHAWNLIPLATGDKHVKSWNKKKNFCCSTHNAWAVHSPESCNLIAKQGQQVNKTITGTNPPAPPARILTSERVLKRELGSRLIKCIK